MIKKYGCYRSFVVILLASTIKMYLAFSPMAIRSKTSRTILRSLSVTVSAEEKVVKDMLFRIKEVNHMPKEIQSSLVGFTVDGVLLGKVGPTMVNRLVNACPSRPIFKIDGSGSLTFTTEAGETCESRTEAVGSVMEELREQNIIGGWRDELYPISQGFYEKPVFLMERAAVSALGGLEYGVHLNGLVGRKDGSQRDERMWIARRSKTKSKYPNMLDHVVAGGQPAGLSLMENVVKECLEEAGIPKDLTLSGIQPAGAVSYETYDSDKDVVSRVVLFCFDLWLPQEFQPVPLDGEVEEFFLWTIEQIKASMSPDFSDPIKPNCYPVIIDYLVRAGHIPPDTPGYLDIIRELRSGECY